MPWSESWRRRSPRQRYWSIAMRPARRSMAASCSAGVSPEGSHLVTPSRHRACRPPTRTMKNSSRFEPVMARNLSRSRRGSAASCAHCSTRSLNSSQLSSRLIKCDEALASGRCRSVVRGIFFFKNDAPPVHLFKHVPFARNAELFDGKILYVFHDDDKPAFFPTAIHRGDALVM